MPAPMSKSIPSPKSSGRQVILRKGPGLEEGRTMPEWETEFSLWSWEGGQRSKGRLWEYNAAMIFRVLLIAL